METCWSSVGAQAMNFDQCRYLPTLAQIGPSWAKLRQTLTKIGRCLRLVFEICSRNAPLSIVRVGSHLISHKPPGGK